jgi:hypothetical protein
LRQSAHQAAHRSAPDIAFSRLTPEELVELDRQEVLAALAANPSNPLALYRLRHLPPR